MKILKTLRKSKNLTQEELADILGVSRYMVNQYENGKRSPSKKTLVKMAEFFNCSLDYLWGGLLEREIQFWREIDKTGNREEQQAQKQEFVSAVETQHRNRMEFFEKITNIADESRELFTLLSEITVEEITLFKLILQLTNEEIDELTNYIDYIISKRK